MADVKWTKEQQDAIYDKGSNILVAAAAGSGKTAVLVERIINKVINENIDIDKILVVTFTNAAASEMRERILDAIYKKIEEFPDNKNLQRQLILINKASICTIDSFCLDIIRNNFFEIDSSANFRVADSTEIELLKQEVIDDVFENKYIEEDKGFLKLVDTYTTYKDEEPLKNLILKIFNYIQSCPFPEEWLDEKVEMFNLKDHLDLDFSETVWGEIILKSAKETVENISLNLKKIENDLSKDDELAKPKARVSEDIEHMEYVLSHMDNWDRCFAAIQEIKWNPWSSNKDYTGEIQEIAHKSREDLKKTYTKNVTNAIICNSRAANEGIYNMYEILKEIENVIFAFSKEFSKRKKEKNMVDFGDIEHFALKILLENKNGKVVQTEVAKKYQERFSEIAIDEYQDSNLVQEYILTSVSNGKNIFMVGDVKQSIYKFRQARPELFLEKYENYKLKNCEDNGEEAEVSNSSCIGQKIQLFKNFRSRQNILDVTNLIFENIMSKELGDILYDRTEFLNLGADYKEPLEPLLNYAGKTEIDIIDLKEKEINVFKDDNNEENDDSVLLDGAERIENIVLEARFVAKKIKTLLDSDYMVFDKHTKEYRHITYKDIVVLLRAPTKSAPIFESEISKLNLPVFSDVSSEYLDSLEIQTILSLLKIIDNPLQDIPLITVLRSSIAGFKDNELVKIRLKNKYQPFFLSLKEYDEDDDLKIKINVFLENIKRWQSQEKYMALDELIWQIYLDTGFYNYVTLMSNGALRQANLKMLFERAKEYESASFKGLFNFISFIDKLHVSSGDLSSAKLISESENVIRIMSIHKSKGLEFPVCFLSCSGKKFNLTDLHKEILLHQDMGIAPKYINKERYIEYDTLAKKAFEIIVNNECLSEEMRILYVALTRAKEKLFITGVSKDFEKFKKEAEAYISIYKSIGCEKVNEFVLKEYKSYLEWIMLVYYNNMDVVNDLFELEVYNKKDLLIDFEKSKIEKKEKNYFKDLKERASHVSEEELEKLKKNILWVYDYLDSISVPTKTSVTRIKQNSIDMSKEEIINSFEGDSFGSDEFSAKHADFDDVLDLIANDTRAEENKETVVYKQEMAKPKFLNEVEKLTGAQRGTLMHMCFQRLDETKDYTMQDIKEFVASMLAKNIITKVEADAINVKKLYEYTQSDLWSELKNAKAIYKEQPFYINFKAGEVYGNNSEENILVQGIIDLYYFNQNDELILVDYKTDRANEGEEQVLVEKYKKQLEIYNDALEKGLNKKVHKKFIYSVCLNKLIEIV